MPAIAWKTLEDRLVDDGKTRFAEIAAEFANQTFYGVFFDADIVNTCVQAHMNSEQRLRQYAEACQLGVQSGTGEPLYPDLTLDQMIEELRWDGGGWGEFAIFPGPELPEVASAHQKLYAEIGTEAEQALLEPFMEMATRAVVRLENEGVFRAFQEN